MKNQWRRDENAPNQNPKIQQNPKTILNLQGDAERLRAESVTLQDKLEQSQGEVYRLKAKLENAQGEHDSLRQELDRSQGGVQRIHSDRDKVRIGDYSILSFTHNEHVPNAARMQTEKKIWKFLFFILN